MSAAKRTPATDGELVIQGQPILWRRNGEMTRRPLFICAHGAGAPLTSAFMEAVATGLVQRGVCVLRFHFPYMERNVREGRRRPPDPATILLQTCRRVIQLARGWLGDAPAAPAAIAVGGKSMGGRMMSMLLAEDPDVGATAAVYFGYPLHAPGRSAHPRSQHLPQVRVPQLFVSGSRDALARLELLRDVVAALPGARLHLVEGGDHSLATDRRDPLAGSAGWLDATAAFLAAAAGAGQELASDDVSG
jgi:uncharacterized protein